MKVIIIKHGKVWISKIIVLGGGLGNRIIVRQEHFSIDLES